MAADLVGWKKFGGETKTKAEGGGETNANEIASLAAFA
jgi:hypothetical protein